MPFRDLDPHELKYANREILAERVAALQQERAEDRQRITDLERRCRRSPG